MWKNKSFIYQIKDFPKDFVTRNQEPISVFLPETIWNEILNVETKCTYQNRENIFLASSTNDIRKYSEKWRLSRKGIVYQIKKHSKAHFCNVHSIVSVCTTAFMLRMVSALRLQFRPLSPECSSDRWQLSQNLCALDCIIVEKHSHIFCFSFKTKFFHFKLILIDVYAKRNIESVWLVSKLYAFLHCFSTNF